MAFTVTLVRHGQTTMNLDKKIQTHTDALLSQLGEEQSILLGGYLKDEKFNQIYSSDLTRALQTAQHILSKNSNKPIPQFRLDQRLRERDFGEWEGKPVELLHEASAAAGTRMHRFNEGVAEKYEDFKAKALAFFTELCEEKTSSADVVLNILIVSHGGWILSLFDALLESDRFTTENLELDTKMRSPVNTSFSRMRIERIENNGASNTKFLIKFETVCDSSHLQLVQISPQSKN